MPFPPVFSPSSFADLPGWSDDDPSPAFTAFRLSALRAAEKPYRNGSLGLTVEGMTPAFEAARNLDQLGLSEARAFFETHFRPARVTPESDAHGLVTAFYEPEVDASPVRTDRFTVPLLARPDDLVDVDDGNRPEGFDPYFAFARRSGETISEFPDRGEIERGALAGRGLEIAWLANRVDAFFIHVQGAARLRMPDGSLRRVTYAAKTGHRFTGIGGILIERGEIARKDMSMQSIRAWLAAHPKLQDELIWHNRSYIFFREAPVEDASLGPVAAAKVPLTPGRSLAVDRLLHTFGTPFFIDAPTLLSFGKKPFRRLMIAQDTGSAIVGAARGDLFAGSGDAAGEIAGAVRHPADFYALVPRTLLEG